MTASLAIGSIVIDCPKPAELAGFYASLLGWTLKSDDPDADWVDVADPNGGPTLSFQLDPKHSAPTWPDPHVAQQFHLDVTVPDLDAEHERVVALGARPLSESHGSYRVYADPAGHPFCLCT